MKSLFFTTLFLLSLCAGVSGQKLNQPGSKKVKVKPELNKQFEQYGYKGAILIYDVKNQKYITNDTSRIHRPYSPASTFKIFNSLVALETGVADGPDFQLKWDSTHYRVPQWNQDQTMRSAFTYSTVWYYQEIARKIGEKRMLEFIEKENFGNRDISGGIDKFWLENTLMITQQEQVEFLTKLYNGKLSSFSKRSMDLVKDIMLSGDTTQYKVRAKTGSAIYDSSNLYIGWYVGYIEKGKNTYIFATNFEAKESDSKNAFGRRKEITLAIFKQLNIIE